MVGRWDGDGGRGRRGGDGERGGGMWWVDRMVMEGEVGGAMWRVEGL